MGSGLIQRVARRGRRGSSEAAGSGAPAPPLAGQACRPDHRGVRSEGGEDEWRVGEYIGVLYLLKKRVRILTQVQRMRSLDACPNCLM